MIARILLAALLTGAALVADSPAVTFHKDVEPILRKNCQSCHRPGQVGPMSLVDFQSARPYARAMKAAVVSRKMPPWFADPQYGPYLNDRSLKTSEIDAIVKWADAGAPEGDIGDARHPLSGPKAGRSSRTSSWRDRRPKSRPVPRTTSSSG